MRVPGSNVGTYRWDALAAVGFLAAILVRFTGLAQESLWGDEVWTKRAVLLSVPDMLQRVAQDQHPPLYFLCLHGWSSIFGTSDLALRSLSAAFGVLTIAVAWVAMRRFVTPQAGSLCVLLLALSPKHLRWSQELRQYALLGLVVWLMVHCALKFSQKPSLKALLALSLACACVLYTHNSGALFVLVTLATLAMTATRGQQRDVQLRLPMVVLITALLYAPWVPNLMAQLQAGGPGYLQGVVPTPPAVVAVIWGDLARFGPANALRDLDPMALALLAVSVCTVFCAFWVGAYALQSRGETARWLLLANSAAVVFIFAGLSAAKGGAWAPKALLPAGLCALALAAVGVTAIRIKPLAISVAVVLLVSGSYGVFMDKTTVEKEQWREVAQYLRLHARGREAIVTTSREHLLTYEPSLESQLAVVPSAHERPDLAATLRPKIAHADRIWVVRTGSDPHVEMYLESLRSVRKTWEYGWVGVRVSLWQQGSFATARPASSE